MNCILYFSILFSFFQPQSRTGKTFVGSTPTHSVVRNFLGISLTDSIDFIRWKLVLKDSQYELACNYGIGKPNTNGFMKGEKKVELTGSFSRQKNICELRYQGKKLALTEVNADLLHFLNTDRTLLVGNGGWSYTLNNTSPTFHNPSVGSATPIIIKDSIAFQGRTPCGVPGIVPAGKDCYKLKWYIVLYSDGRSNVHGHYRLLGTGWRAQGGIRGSWDVKQSSETTQGGLLYQLKDENGKTFIRLLKIDDGVLVFTDANGKLLVGDEDFSYSMNRKF